MFFTEKLNLGIKELLIILIIIAGLIFIVLLMKWLFFPKKVEQRIVNQKIQGKLFRIIPYSDGTWKTQDHNLNISGDSPESVGEKLKRYFGIK